MSQWITDTRLQRTAYHEAGHAVIATRMGVTLHRVRVYIADRTGAQGNVTTKLLSSYETSRHAHGVYTAAGALAEFYRFGDITPGSDGGDQSQMIVWAAALTCDVVQQAHVRRQWRLRAGALLVECWPTVEIVAQMLIERGRARLAQQRKPRFARQMTGRYGAAVQLPGQVVTAMFTDLGRSKEARAWWEATPDPQVAQ